MMRTLCFVEDDPTIRELVSEKLTAVGYTVDVYDTAENVVKELGSREWDFYLLDVLLAGDLSGLELCATIRKKNPVVPVLMLSALSEPSDRIDGLKSGADDYLGKPFEMEELLLRIEGMFTRRAWYHRLPKNSSRFEWDGRGVDFTKLEGWTGKEHFSLSQKECMLLKLLVEREGEVVSREEILDKVWGYDVFPSTRTVDNFIVRLRKFYDNPGQPRYLHSVRGMGYRFTTEGLH